MAGIPVKANLANQPFGLLKIARTARRNVLEIIPELATIQLMVSGRTVRRWHMVMDPVALRRVLMEKADRYPKSEVVKNVLGPVIGESLFLAEGRSWLWQKRAASPVFSARNISGLGPIMAASAVRMVERLRSAEKPAVDMHAEFTASTFEVISDVMFAGNGAIDRSVAARAIEIYVARSARTSVLDIAGAPSWIPRFGRLFPAKEVRQLKAAADAAIRRRRDAGNSSGKDLHDLLAAAVDPKTGRKMNPVELRDNLLTFVVAGHETTALALSWALYLLAFDRDAQERAREEVLSVVVDGCACADDLACLPFVNKVLKEALRLYPPAGLMLRTALDADELWGREIRPGDSILIPIYALHRSHCLWENPDGFDPDRFAEPNDLDRFQYLPFGGGPRSCIGSNFAMQEAGMLLSTLLANFRFTLAEGRRPEPVLILTTRPEGGVWLMPEPL